MPSETLESENKPLSEAGVSPIVFISYSQACANKTKVEKLAARLTKDGCDVRIDFAKESDEDWIQWMNRQLTEANYVLCIISQSYAERFRRDANLDEGYGVAWEAGLIARNLYFDKWQNRRFLPCFFTRTERKHVPDELKAYDEYLLDSQAGYEKLLRRIYNSPTKKLPPRGKPPELGTSTIEPDLFTNDQTTPVDVSDESDQLSNRVEAPANPIDSNLLNALLSRINRFEQIESLQEFLSDEPIAQQVGEVGAACVITGADADACLDLFALTCLECFADSVDVSSEDELLQMLRSSVIQPMLPLSLAGNSLRVGQKLQREIECVDPEQWAIFYCHIDKASKAVKAAEAFLNWRKDSYTIDGRRVLLVLFTDRIGRGRAVPSLTCVVQSPAPIEGEHLKQWNLYLQGRTYLSKAQKQIVETTLDKLKQGSTALSIIQNKLHNALSGV